MADFPCDIINEILLELPVKSLCKFRCVSKYWRSLISDPQFISNHVRISSSSDYNYTDRHKILLKWKGRGLKLKSCSVSSLFNKPSTFAVDIDHPLFRKPVKSVKVVGSCNGLLCVVVDGETMYLWNPTIRESRRLPDSGLVVGSHKLDRITYGFGYDSSIDDYKVVVLCSYGPYGPFDTKVMVYTLRNECWRPVVDFPFGSVISPGLFIGGALIWHGLNFDEGGFKVDDLCVSWHIFAFELATEKQTRLPQPASEKLGNDISLGKLEECLCLLSHYNRKHADIWVMKEYGVEESWCKMFTIPYGQNHFNMGCYPFYRTLMYSEKNGKLILEFGSGLVLYCPENMTPRKLRIRNFQPCVESITYVESLVSPNVVTRAETLKQ